jgi:RNA polymerase sigma-70 factor, ECF subfamily
MNRSDPTRAGSPEQALLEECYRTFGFRIYGRCLQILADEQAAQDVMQEVFVRLAHSLDTFRGDSSIGTWIYVVTTREALGYIRSRARRSAREARWASGVASHHGSAEARIGAAEQIRAAVGRAPDDSVEAALLYFVDHLRQDEIADLLGVSRRTVIRRINTFRDAVKDLEPKRAVGQSPDLSGRRTR